MRAYNTQKIFLTLLLENLGFFTTNVPYYTLTALDQKLF